MKVHKVTLCIVDTDEVGEDEIRAIIENQRYPNWCIHPDVVEFESRDIGEWDDDHPLNQTDAAEAEFRRLFGMGES